MDQSRASFTLNVQNSIKVSSDSHVDVDPVDSTPPNAPKPPFENEPIVHLQFKAILLIGITLLPNCLK